ncbi:LCP family protein [Geodermatophilus sp. TF02-6]|uniref:LCP family protein n=1 Tax=Geodermatophilus sp. TF02-6 TaxID=2250575 RepID=UPI001F3926E7|nr:LCP family protein [Geodermatophilus sp. TF02-6]
MPGAPIARPPDAAADPAPRPAPAAGPQPSRPISPLPPIPGRDVPQPGATRPAPPSPRERRAAKRAARSPRRRRLVRAAVALAALVGVVLAYHVGLYLYVDRDIQRVDALAPDGAEVLAPRLQEGAATYLVVGTGLPGAAGAGTVAPLLVHVTPDQQRAVLVSIPPTALVDTPACARADGEIREPATEAIATALLDGGPSCLVRAVQQLSGLRVDHYLGVDLTRLSAVVDALGGVGVCLPAVTPAVDASADPLPAGRSALSGERAVGYLTPGGADSDVTGRAVAERVELLLTATLRTATSGATIGDPVTLTRFLTRASDALTVDEGTNLGDLRTLAGTLGDLAGDAVQRAGLPVAQVGYVPAGTDQAYVLLDAATTRTLFDALIEEGRLPAELVAQEPADGAASPTPTAPPATPTGHQPAPSPASQPLTAAPSGITVDVLNGTATSGLAATVADQLRGQGFGVGQVGNEPGAVDRTVVRFEPGAEQQARTVAAAVPGSQLQPSDSVGGAVQLVLGPGYSSVVPVLIPEVTPAADAAAPSAEPVAAAPASC